MGFAEDLFDWGWCREFGSVSVVVVVVVWNRQPDWRTLGFVNSGVRTEGWAVNDENWPVVANSQDHVPTRVCFSS